MESDIWLHQKKLHRRVQGIHGLHFAVKGFDDCG